MVVTTCSAVRKVTKANPVFLFVRLSMGILVSVMARTLRTTPQYPIWLNCLARILPASTIVFVSAIGFGFGPLTLAVIRCNVLPLKLVPLRVETVVVAFLAAVRVTKANPVCLFVGLSTGSLVSVIGPTMQTTPQIEALNVLLCGVANVP